MIPRDRAGDPSGHGAGRREAARSLRVIISGPRYYLTSLSDRRSHTHNGFMVEGIPTQTVGLPTSETIQGHRAGAVSGWAARRPFGCRRSRCVRGLICRRRRTGGEVHDVILGQVGSSC